MGVTTTTAATATTNPEIHDDKSPICIPFILSRLRAHRESGTTRPFVIGLNGVQGVGKTTLVRRLADTLRQDERLETLVCSIDDFYLAHEDQVALAASAPDNALVQVRGEPGMSFRPLFHHPPLSSPSSLLSLTLSLSLSFSFSSYLFAAKRMYLSITIHVPPFTNSFGIHSLKPHTPIFLEMSAFNQLSIIF